MRAAGATLIEDMGSHAVMGYAGVVRQIPFHLRLLRRLEKRMRGGERRTRHSRRLSRIQPARCGGGTRGGRARALLHHAEGVGVARGAVEGDAPLDHARRGHPAVRGGVSEAARHCRHLCRQSAARRCARAALAQRGARAARNSGWRSRARALSREPSRRARAPSRRVHRHRARAGAPRPGAARDRQRCAEHAASTRSACRTSSCTAIRTRCGARPTRRS